MTIQTQRPKFVERKSDLQTRLENEGWKFCRNIQIWHPNWKAAKRKTPLTDKDISIKYLTAGFLEVRVEGAYDIEGPFIEDSRAVYYKGDIPTDWLRKTTFTE